MTDGSPASAPAIGGPAIALDPELPVTGLAGLLDLAACLPDASPRERTRRLLATAAAHDLFSGRVPGARPRRSDLLACLGLDRVVARARADVDAPGADVPATEAARAYLSALDGDADAILSGTVTGTERAVTEDLGDSALAALFPHPALDRHLARRRRDARLACAMAGVPPGTEWVTPSMERVIRSGGDWHGALVAERAAMHGVPVPPDRFARMYVALSIGGEREVLLAACVHPEAPVPHTLPEAEAMHDVGWFWSALTDGTGPSVRATDDLSGGWEGYRRALDDHFGPAPEGFLPGAPVEAARAAMRAMADALWRDMRAVQRDGAADLDVVGAIAAAIARRCASLDEVFAFARMARDDGWMGPAGVPDAFVDWDAILPSGLSGESLRELAREVVGIHARNRQRGPDATRAGTKGDRRRVR